MSISSSIGSFTLPSILDGEDKNCPFKNCIRNTYRHLKKWAKRTHTNCFRIYDRQIKEYPFAIDFYDGKFCVHYFASSQEEEVPEESISLITSTLFSLFLTPPEDIYFRMRIKREKFQQYHKAEERALSFPVLEYGITFIINLSTYLDTGLFLDHRETRNLVRSLAEGKRVLNLFAYTCSFSVHAAYGGATFTKSVDMSQTYTRIGKENFLQNGFALANHIIVCEDCLKFLEKEKEKYDLIIIDPPTISRSKKMEQFFDIQVDYLFLLSKALNLLQDNGAIFFSTNSRKFTFDLTAFPDCTILDISKKTTPLDFPHPKIHKCWKISKKG